MKSLDRQTSLVAKSNNEVCFEQRKLVNLKPVFESDLESARKVARSSVIYHDMKIVKKLLNDAFIFEQYNAKRLLITKYIQRGFLNMVTLLDEEYVTFLKSKNSLFQMYMEQLKFQFSIANFDLPPGEPILSKDLLELKLDHLR